MDRPRQVYDERERVVRTLLSDPHKSSRIAGWGVKPNDDEARTITTAEVLAGLGEYGKADDGALLPHLDKLRELLKEELASKGPGVVRHLSWAAWAFAACGCSDDAASCAEELMSRAVRAADHEHAWWLDKWKKISIYETFFAAWALCKVNAKLTCSKKRTEVERVVAMACGWLAEKQASDGGWAGHPGDPATAAATAYVCLLLTFWDAPTYADNIREGLSFIHSALENGVYEFASDTSDDTWTKPKKSSSSETSTDIGYDHSETQWGLMALLIQLRSDKKDRWLQSSDRRDSAADADTDDLHDTYYVAVDRLLVLLLGSLRQEIAGHAWYRHEVDAPPSVFATADALFAFNLLYENAHQQDIHPVCYLLEIHKVEQDLLDRFAEQTEQAKAEVEQAKAEVEQAKAEVEQAKVASKQQARDVSARLRQRREQIAADRRSLQNDQLSLQNDQLALQNEQKRFRRETLLVPTIVAVLIFVAFTWFGAALLTLQLPGAEWLEWASLSVGALAYVITGSLVSRMTDRAINILSGWTGGLIGLYYLIMQLLHALFRFPWPWQ